MPEQMVAFLTRNREQAFTRSEIVATIDGDPNTVGAAISRLNDRGFVRHMGKFWAVTDDLERVSAAYEIHGALARIDREDVGFEADKWVAAVPTESHPSERDGE